MIPMSEDDAHREALDAMLKADGWCLCYYVTDGAGNDAVNFITNAVREVPYILTRAVAHWEAGLDIPPMRGLDDLDDDDDDLD